MTVAGDGGRGTVTVMVKTAGRLRGVRDPLLYLLGAGVGAMLLLLRDPHIAGNLGVCPSRLLLGVYCPGCGSMRGCYDILHGNILEAVQHNILLVPALIWLTWWWVARLLAGAGHEVKGPPDGRVFSLGLLAVVLTFTVLRNLPGSPLAP